MKKKILISTSIVVFIILAVIGYNVYSYLTPVLCSPSVGFPTSLAPPNVENYVYKPYTPESKYVQMLSTPSYIPKRGFELPDKYQQINNKYGEEGKAVFEEVYSFIAPTYIKVSFKIVGNDTIATYHGNATTKDGEAIEYSRDIVFEDMVFDFISSYGPVERVE